MRASRRSRGPVFRKFLRRLNEHNRRYVTFRFVTLRYVSSHRGSGTVVSGGTKKNRRFYVTVRYVMLRYVNGTVKLRYAALHYVTLHRGLVRFGQVGLGRVGSGRVGSGGAKTNNQGMQCMVRLIAAEMDDRDEQRQRADMICSTRFDSIQSGPIVTAKAAKNEPNRTEQERNRTGTERNRTRAAERRKGLHWLSCTSIHLDLVERAEKKPETQTHHTYNTRRTAPSINTCQTTAGTKNNEILPVPHQINRAAAAELSVARAPGEREGVPCFVFTGVGALVGFFRSHARQTERAGERIQHYSKHTHTHTQTHTYVYTSQRYSSERRLS